MDKPLAVSIVVTTRDRPKDLADLLLTLFNQTHSPLEVIVVDDSLMGSAKDVVSFFPSKFESSDCRLKYVKGSGDGLPTARNLGVEICEGDAILFLDDDTLLDQNVVSTLATFIGDNPKVMGAQPKIVSPERKRGGNGLAEKFENAIYKALMLTYKDENKLAVRRSGTSVFPNGLTEVTDAQRLQGCCCYRREVFTRLSFDTNLKRWGFMEDLDFSYRLYLKNRGSLYAIPYAKIIHKRSIDARLPTKLSIYMRTIYWFYVFFKDIFRGSVINLIAFLWALAGNVIAISGGLIIQKKPKSEWSGLIFLLGSYLTALGHLKSIRMQRLEFFNKNLR